MRIHYAVELWTEILMRLHRKLSLIRSDDDANSLACYQMTQAVLAEAICLIRGDRFLTTDFTPALLTAWGYNDCKRDPHNGGFGGARRFSHSRRTTHFSNRF